MLKAIYFALHFAMIFLGVVYAIHFEFWIGILIAITLKFVSTVWFSCLLILDWLILFVHTYTHPVNQIVIDTKYSQVYSIMVVWAKGKKLEARAYLSLFFPSYKNLKK